MKSPSSSQRIPTYLKLKEAYRQFDLLRKSRNPFSSRDFSYLYDQFKEYDNLTRLHVGAGLSEISAFEIGCGQRPYRLFFLISQGTNAYGVDTDRVLFSISMSSIFESLNRNGWERTLKTGLRHIVFDRSENRQLKSFLSKNGEFQWPLDRILCGNAADELFWPEEPVDYIYSEDVFEHIPKELLPLVCKNMAKSLSARGIAFIRPMIFTGIQGGHNVEWYDATTSKSRECQPWDHLREHRHPANTYLNKLRLQDYRDIFSERFEIIDEINKNNSVGRRYLTPSIRQELSIYTDEELFANNIGFVLRLKGS